MTSFVLRGSASALAIALMLFACIAQHTLARGAGELRESDRAFDAGQLELAVQHARSAAIAYVPGAEHVSLAYARLRAVARGAEHARDVELSNVAWRAMRAAAIESRHLWQPRSEELQEADREMARLSHAPPVNAPSEQPAGLPVWVLSLLTAGAVCATFGLIGLCGGAGSDGPDVAWSGSAKPEFRGRFAALSCLVGVLMWGLALLNA